MHLDRWHYNHHHGTNFAQRKCWSEVTWHDERGRYRVRKTGWLPFVIHKQSPGVAQVNEGVFANAANSMIGSSANELRAWQLDNGSYGVVRQETAARFYAASPLISRRFNRLLRAKREACQIVALQTVDSRDTSIVLRNKLSFQLTTLNICYNNCLNIYLTDFTNTYIIQYKIWQAVNINKFLKTIIIMFRSRIQTSLLLSTTRCVTLSFEVRNEILAEGLKLNEDINVEAFLV